MPKVEDIFSKLNGATYFTMLDLRAGYHHILLDKSSIPKTAFNLPFRKYDICQGTIWISSGTCILLRADDWHPEGFQFCNSLFRLHHNIQQHSRRTSFTHQEGIQETTISQTLHENEQMQLLFQGNLVFRVHSKCHRDLTTTIKNTCHTTYATTHYTQTSLSISWISWLLQKIYKWLCQNSKTINIAYTPTGKV